MRCVRPDFGWAGLQQQLVAAPGVTHVPGRKYAAFTSRKVPSKLAYGKTLAGKAAAIAARQKTASTALHYCCVTPWVSPDAAAAALL